VAAAARNLGATRIVPGASLREVCEEVEAEIRRRGAHPAFPAQSSRNHIAAHYCASPEDETVYAAGDLAKLDIGVHVDGFVVDTAVTVNVGGVKENQRMVDAARAALDAAIAQAGPGVPVSRLSAVIEAMIRSYGLRPMRNLCGHGVGRWVVHCPPPIPNVPDGEPTRLPEGSVVAIEPFATDGHGLVAERGTPEVFRLDPARDPGNGVDPGVLATLQGLRGLPFARRDLRAHPRPTVEATLAVLLARGVLHGYAPLVEAGGRLVAQAEHTVHIGSNGAEVLTR
jgi:methionyl aminopeptidase